MAIVIIHGDKATGKTVNAERFKQQYRCARILDGWPDDAGSRGRGDPRNGDLILTTRSPREMQRALKGKLTGDEVIFIGIDRARAEAGLPAFGCRQRDLDQLVTDANLFLKTMTYDAAEGLALRGIVDEFVKLRAVLKPFATASISQQGGDKLADWHEQHDSEGIELVWDPEFENGSTLTIGQFKRARAAYLGEA